MRREIPKKPDVQALLAKAGAGKKRKRSSAGILIALFLLAALLGLIYLLARPGTDPVPLMVVAPDQIALPDEAIPLRAQLVPQDEGDGDINLEGFDLFFSDSLLVGPAGGPGEKPMQEKAQTGPGGEAAIEWKCPAREQPRSFVVRYPGDKRRPASNDQGSVYVLAPNRPLLLVEARHGLLGVEEEQFRKANVFDLSAMPGVAPTVLGTTSAGLGASSPAISPLAALSVLVAGKAEGPPEALHKARAKDYQIVYLATAPGRPEQYRKLRGWLQLHVPPADRLFPEGPVLGRESYTEPQDEAAALRAVVRSLKGRFKGKLIGVVGRAGDARIFGEEGLTTFLVGDGVKLPARVTRVLTWRELAKRLP
jgi:hypothetical protein